MIDLHLHTTASDGRSTPQELVCQAYAAGLRTIAVTDHDTVAALPEVRTEAAARGMSLVAGIEITAVSGGRDLHILGYFIDETHSGLAAFLEVQRADRRRRVAEIGERLLALGISIDVAALLDQAAREHGRAVGRPAIARALVEGGFASDIADAFDRFLGAGAPAFVERRGASPEAVITHIVDAGGVASVAHPGKSGRDDLLPGLAHHGLRAIEVFHPDHTDKDAARYLATASELGLLVTGGSDYHGPGSGRSVALGQVSLDTRYFTDLLAGIGRL